jgi:hypothetical protein
MTVYVVVWKDRHVDDVIRVFTTLERANADLEAIMAGYEQPDAEWEEHRYGVPKWARYVRGVAHRSPNGRIEVAELDPEAT